MTTSNKTKIQNLSANNNWLFQHMITAFWHGFGISNGLRLEEKDIEKVKYKGDKKTYYVVKAEVMQSKLEEYIKWLENYQESWDTDLFADSEKEDFYNQYHEKRNLITKMIELLQV